MEKSAISILLLPLKNLCFGAGPITVANVSEYLLSVKGVLD